MLPSLAIWGLSFIFLVLLIIIIYTKCTFTHLEGSWYVVKKSGQIGQWCNPLRIYRLHKEKKQSVFHGLSAAFSKLETEKGYWTETHLLPHLQLMERRGRIEIKSCVETKKRFIYEYIPVLGLRKYLKKRFARNAKDDKQIYKQFYRIHFIKN